MKPEIVITRLQASGTYPIDYTTDLVFTIKNDVEDYALFDEAYIDLSEATIQEKTDIVFHLEPRTDARYARRRNHSRDRFISLDEPDHSDRNDHPARRRPRNRRIFTPRAHPPLTPLQAPHTAGLFLC